MRIYDLKQKEVINAKDCQRLGYVGDIEFDIITGQITKIIVPGPCKLWGVIGHDHEYCISFCCIRQIGTDVILVDVDIEKVLIKCQY